MTTYSRHPRHPMPVRHWTVETVSDHDAYLVEYRFPSGELLVIGTFNLSHSAAVRRPARLEVDLREVARQCDVLLIQEAGAAKGIVWRAAHHEGMAAYFGEDGDTPAASTPILAKPDLEHLRFKSYPILGPRRLDPRAAGPSRSKPKRLNVAIFGKGRDSTAVGNIHATPSTRFRLNAIAALLMFTRSARRLERIDVWWRFAGGDLNQIPGARFLAAWRQIPLRSSQRRLGPIGTHGKRPIDDIYGEVSRG